VGALGKRWFGENNLKSQLELIIHEIAHIDGHHCEAGYHQALTKIGSNLIMIAMEDPNWLRIKREGNPEIKKLVDGGK
jgi:hypothetical protein